MLLKNEEKLINKGGRGKVRPRNTWTAKFLFGERKTIFLFFIYPWIDGGTLRGPGPDQASPDLKQHRHKCCPSHNTGSIGDISVRLGDRESQGGSEHLHPHQHFHHEPCDGLVDQTEILHEFSVLAKLDIPPRYDQVGQRGEALHPLSGLADIGPLQGDGLKLKLKI